MMKPSADLLSSLFVYSDFHKGLLHKETRRGGRIKAGSRASYLTKKGVAVIHVKGWSNLTEAGAVWAMHRGTWPSEKLIHINGDPLDNRIENLSLYSRGDNSPDQNRIRELFDYREDGVLIRKQQRSSVGRVGLIAGADHGSGYRMVGIDGKRYKVHRIIWVMHNGAIPDGIDIDHINGQRDDNRIENLRLATRYQNTQNTKVRIDSSTGVKGVHRRGSGYRAYIQVNKKLTWLGTFPTLEEAASARAAAELENHPCRRLGGSHKPSIINED